MKIRIYLKSQINSKFFLDGDVSKEEYSEMCSYLFSTFTLGKITIMRGEIMGWEVK